MLSTSILNRTISTMAKLTGDDIRLYSSEGIKLVESFENDADVGPLVKEFSLSTAESQTASGYRFFKVFDEGKVEYVIIIKESDTADNTGKIVTFQLEELCFAYKERIDKDNYIKNLLLDNMLLVDIYGKSKKLNIEIYEKRAVMIVNIPTEYDGNELGKVRDILRPSEKDFVTAIDENSIVVVLSLPESATEEDIEKKANGVISGFSADIRDKVRVSFGTIVNEIKEVSKSYKEAIMAMDIGSTFFKDRQVIAYSVLGIARLIYQLPIPLCKMFINEIFSDKRPDDFDEEMTSTINKFFENSLNVSETSRQLYIHRNTLVYRLDKLEKSTGLDLRVFEDAITFKIAMMVIEYMKSMEV